MQTSWASQSTWWKKGRKIDKPARIKKSATLKDKTNGKETNDPARKEKRRSKP
jgi:hypothetical protein